MKGMILTAGIGSRLKELTKDTPKALVKLGEHRMLDLAIGYLNKYGIDDIIINVHHLADQLMEYVAQKRWAGHKLSISDETAQLLNTGGALVKASNFFKEEENIVLMACDVLTDLDLKSMINFHCLQQNLVTLAVKHRNTSRSLLFDKEGLLAGWKHNETKEDKIVPGRIAEESYGFSGIHVINTKIFKLIEEQGAFSIVDLYLRLARENNIGRFDHSGGTWIEFGRVERIKEQVKSEDYRNMVKEIGEYL